MRAEIVSVGTELLLGQIVDTNASALGRLLAEHGLDHMHRQTVGDNLERLIDALRLALARAEVVFTIGGLGPTEDDLTRDGIAAALGEPLITDRELETELRAIFTSRGLPFVETNLRQATRPPCADPIPNPNGTSPGLICRKEGKVLIALPGPKGEFEPMLRRAVRDELRRLNRSQVFASRTLRTCGIGESVLEDRIRGLLALQNPTVATYAKVGEVHLRLTARAATEESAYACIEPIETRVREILGDVVYGVDEETLEGSILAQLVSCGWTLAVAESCTAGGLAARVTNWPGASAAFEGGIVAYSNSVKVRELGIRKEVLAAHGAVSKEVALAMADGVRDRFETDWAVSVTGVAGPGGGTEDKPVGLVWIGVAGPYGTMAERQQIRGDRAQVRERAVATALIHLRRRLMQGP